jgi:hypothetical protein
MIAILGDPKMIDLESARARTDWLTSLRVGDPVILHTPFGARPATVTDILAARITVGWHTAEGGDVTTWVHRDTGNLPGGRIFISPAPAPDPGPGPYAPFGDWEAA